MRNNCFYIYILASKKDGVLYTGVTNDLTRRVCEHKNGINDGFSRKYHVHRLVYFEQYYNVQSAIAREKCIKKWNRQWKIRLIEEHNPEWGDLAEGILGLEETL